MSNELLDYFKGDELAAGVWKGKYALSTEVTPDDMHKRLAKEFIKVEQKYQKNEVFIDKSNLSYYGKTRVNLTEQSIYELFKDFKYIVPQGRVMSGLGANESYRSLSNCLRLPPPKDSYSSIMYSDTMLVSAAKRGCGYGLGLSNIRPEGMPVSNAASSSTGAHSFQERYSNSTREVAQEGRRGACLEDLDIKHPDSLKFINSKKDRTKVTGANISVKCTDDFYEAVEANSDFILRYPCDITITTNTDNLEYNKLLKVDEGYIKKIKAKTYFDAVIENAWENAEPGVFNWTRVLEYDPSNVYKKYYIDGTNACGEQPMAVYDTCRLILQNLYSFVKNPFKLDAEVDYELLYKMSYEQSRLGDDLVDLEVIYLDRILNKIKSDDLPDEEKVIEITLWNNVKDIALSGRRVGCGITALGDMLAALNLKYDSEKSLETVDKVMATKMRAELDCFIDLAILRGTFVGFDAKLEKDGNSWYKFVEKEFPTQWENMQKFGRRSVNFNTIAPAGSVSILTQTTSGCEPIFMPYYMRRKKINPNEKGNRIDFVDQIGDSWQEFPVLHQKFKYWCDENISSEIKIESWTKEQLEKAFEQSPWYKSTANDINWVKRVEMQSVLQKYTTSAISSTLNLPNEATKEEVAEIYLQAWKMGLKGVTVYRDGSRSGVLVDTSKEVKTNFEYKDAVKRPKQLVCDIYSVQSKGKKWNILVGLLEDKPYEVFIVNYFTEEKKLNLVKKARGKYDLHKGKEIYSENVTSEMSDEQAAITRLTSTSLRHGTDIKYIVEQLNKCEGDLYSFTKSLARTLKKYIPEGAKSTVSCQECGSTNVIFQEGCSSCLECGSSKCG